MPTYDFCCTACKHVYDDLCPFDEKGKYPSVSCPKCKSKKKSRVYNFCNIVLKGTSSTSHEVAFGYKYEQAQELRKKAEAESHMGGGGYTAIDDISSGNHFGEVK